MQYSLVGTDPQGRLIYEPVSQSPDTSIQISGPPQNTGCHGCPCHGSQKAAKKDGDSWFSQWFVMEQGVISISLKNLTIVSALSISVTLLYILYASCNDGTGRYVCTYERFPMISDVINQEMYNRVFILLTAIFMFGVQQVNIRAYYKQLYGKVSNSTNDTAFWFGFASLVALPMVGIFDESRWSTLHGISAGIFFIGFMVYGTMVGRSLYKYRDQFPPEEQAAINTIHNSVSTM